MADQSQFTFDVFISYSHANKDWVHNWLLPKLEAEQQRVCIDIRDFDIGKAAIENMESAVDNSLHVLLVLTPAWLASEWSGFEGLLAQSADPAARRRKLIGLMLEECKLPSRLAMLTYADFKQKDQWEMQLARVLKSVRGQSNFSR